MLHYSTECLLPHEKGMYPEKEMEATPLETFQFPKNYSSLKYNPRRQTKNSSLSVLVLCEETRHGRP